jgi:ribosome maturation factor RimP
MELVEPVLREQGLELVDLELHPEGHGQILRLLVDREGGIDLEALSRLSRELSDLLDVSEPIHGRYTLEVSSPGMNRPLTKPEHFVRFLGTKARIRTAEPIDGQRNFLGTISAVTAGGVTVRIESGAETYIPFSNIEKANYEHDFSAADFGRSKGAEASSAPRRLHGVKA